MQEEEKNNDMEGMFVKEMFPGVQESYQEAQLRAQEKNKAFARAELFRMDKFGIYRLRVLSIAPDPDDSPTCPGYEYPVHQLFLELKKPATGNKPQKMYVTVTRATDTGYSAGPIEVYHRMAVEAAKEDGNDKPAEKVAGDSFEDGLKYSYGYCLYVFDLGERTKDMQMTTLSHVQFKGLDEREFKLWSKKLTKNPFYPCLISSMYDAYLAEIERHESGAKAEYVISIGNESEPVPLTKEELTALMGALCILEIICRYTRYHLGITVESFKRCDSIYGMSLIETDGMKTIIDTLDGELSKEDISAFSFDRHMKDNKENRREGGGISLGDSFERYDELQRQELGGKTKEDQELHAAIRSYIEQEGLPVRVTRSTSNQELLDLIGSKMEGPKPSDESEDVPGEEEEQLEETEERIGHLRHHR